MSTGAVNVRVRAADWNKAVSDCGRLVPKPGRGILVDRKPEGSSISADPLLAWRHPWNVVPRWRGNGWYLNINPGFVNGDSVIVVGSAPEPKNEEDKPQDLELTQVPWWKVVETNIVTDAVPQFFQEKGVANLQQLSAALTIANFDRINLSALVEEAAKKGERILRSVDVFLTQSRPMLVTKFVQVDSGAAGTTLQYEAGYDTTAFDRDKGRAKLRQAVKFMENKVPDPALRLLGIEPDEPEDRIRIATVYFLSDNNRRNELDKNWIPYVKHNVFWNLNHMTKNSPPSVPRARPPIFTGLAGGLGDLLINEYQALISILEAEAYLWLREDEVGGAFWTT